MTATPFAFSDAYDAAQSKLTLRGLTHIAPELIAFLREKRVRVFDASFGSLSSLPEDFAHLSDLEVAFFSNNMFESAPRVLGRLRNLRVLAFKSNGMKRIDTDALPPSLRWLMLTDNALEDLPAAIGNLAHLEKLALAGNRLSRLPGGMQNCRKLALLRLSANAFNTAPPDWLFSMPDLAWYSDGGNDFVPRARADFSIAGVDWPSLAIHGLINESPSSVVYRASLADGTAVAAKIFKGGLTSDGYPEDDMRAALAAGAHEHLLQIRARITGHPEGRQGLALALIPPDYKQLGKPPTLETCSRDSYPPGTRFGADFTAATLRGIAAAAMHIHAKGLMHGDLYAHNILARDDGHALLGDFGAASFYDTQAHVRERLDVKAFGYLMDDMVSRIDGDTGPLAGIRDACLMQDTAARPSFAALCRHLRF